MRPAAFERLVADPSLRESLAKAGTTVDALLAEWGWSLVDAAKPAEADRVFSRLLTESSPEPLCGRCAVQPRGIGLPGSSCIRR